MRGYYTEEQCQENLAESPNSSDADKVRKRLDSFSTDDTDKNKDKVPITSTAASNDVTEGNPKKNNPKKNNPKKNNLQKNNPQKNDSQKNNPKKNDDLTVWQSLILVAVGIGLILLVIFLIIRLWEWLIDTFPILVGILFIIVIFRNMFFKD